MKKEKRRKNQHYKINLETLIRIIAMYTILIESLSANIIITLNDKQPRDRDRQRKKSRQQKIINGCLYRTLALPSFVTFIRLEFKDKHSC